MLSDGQGRRPGAAAPAVDAGLARRVASRRLLPGAPTARTAAVERPVRRDGYRPALDGVRAVAVLAVFAYHLGWLPGGFLGVDVFFVLSGYLITSLLLREFASRGTISLTDFWSRRVRRLLPAVLLLVIACLLEVTVIQSELAVRGTRRLDVLSTLLYYANWHFIASAQSYFDTYAGVSPLRHMWSLAIEEQFYVVWPLLTLVALKVLRSRRVLLSLIGAGALASVVAMALLYRPADPSRAYFGTDARAHVLLVGAALAVLLERRPAFVQGERAAAVARRAGPAAAVLVAVALALLGDTASFYYRGGSLLFAALVAVVLWSLEAVPVSLLGRGASVAPARWTGKISYSLYLWHWPLILWVGSFIDVSAPLQKAIVIGGTFTLAAMSYVIVESPIRRGRAPWLRASKLRLALVAPIVLAVVVGATFRATATSSADRSERPCPPGSPSLDGYRWCMRVRDPAPAAPLVVTAGDSTSRALDPGMEVVARRRGWSYIQAGQNGCSVLPLAILRQPSSCMRTMPALISRLEREFHPDVWLVSDVFALSPFRAADGTIVGAGDPRRVRLVEHALRSTLRLMTAGHAHVVLLSTPPTAAPGHCGARTSGRVCGAVTYTVRNPQIEQMAAIERRVAAEQPGRVTFLSVTDLLCPQEGHCPALVGGATARYDGVHFTGTFSKRIVPVIVRRAERAGITFGGTGLASAS